MKMSLLKRRDVFFNFGDFLFLFLFLLFLIKVDLQQQQQKLCLFNLIKINKFRSLNRWFYISFLVVRFTLSI